MDKNYAWRTVVVDTRSQLSYDNGNLCIENDSTKEVPLSQVRNLIVTSNATNLTGPLLTELARNDVSVILCDERFNPTCEVVPISDHSETAGKIFDQIAWDIERKSEIWQQIVKQKIKNQASVLSLSGCAVPFRMNDYYKEVKPDDPDNREAQAARIYFTNLFGRDFTRHLPCDTNSALNYGYAIIQSSFTRVLTMHGYNTALGIKHCSKANRFNLSCDLMEPFRPFVDRIVFENDARILDYAYKKVLIGVLQSGVRYGGKKMTLADAIEAYALDVLGALSGDRKIKEISFD